MIHLMKTSQYISFIRWIIKIYLFSKYVTRTIPNFLTQSRCMHSGSYPKISIPAQLHNIVKFQKHWTLFYLTLAEVLYKLGTQLTMFLELPYLEWYWITYEWCYATFHSNTPLPYVQQMRKSYFAISLLKAKVTHCPHICIFARFVWL